LPAETRKYVERVTGTLAGDLTQKKVIKPTPLQSEQAKADIAAQSEISKKAALGPVEAENAAMKAVAEETAKIDAEKSGMAPNRIRILDNRLSDLDQAIAALDPKKDKLTGKITGFGFETGGFLGGSGLTPSWYYEVKNDPRWRTLQRVGVGEELNRAVEDMAKQGQITEAERNLLKLATGLDPSKQRSEELYKMLVQARDRLKGLREQWSEKLSPEDRKKARLEELRRELGAMQ
jgi:uncharacterized phage infection (PIP) family protein YhgE